MKVAIWDTYVTKKEGGLMHFDILVPYTEKNEPIIYGFGKKFLVSKGQAGQPLASAQCQFCHVENATPEMIQAIQQQGFAILEMEGR